MEKIRRSGRVGAVLVVSAAMAIHIRRATVDDASALSRICLLTADAGVSAEHLYTHGDLPGLIWALPYVQLPHTWGFVMEDEDTRQVVGYILGALDTRAFESSADQFWWPPIREKYPLPPSPPSVDLSHSDDNMILKEADRNCIRHIHESNRAADSCVAYSPAHLHIDILSEYQRQGWGRRLVGTAVKYLRTQGLDAVWLGMDPRNDAAKEFYGRIGFEPLDAPGMPPACVGLQFAKWRH